MRFFDERQHRNDVLWIRYESLVDDMTNATQGLAADLGLELSDEVKEYAKAPPLSRTVTAEPDRTKWIRNNYRDIVSILPMIKDAAQRIGYDVSL